MIRFALALLVAGATFVAAAQTLAVDGSGGPLTLLEDVEAAVAAWQAVADPPLPLAVAEGGDTAVRYAREVALGPDTLALTLVRQGNDAGPPLEIVVSPERYALSPATLLHEVGIVLGLRPSLAEGSAMRAAQSPESPSTPSEEDAEALARLRAAVPEDVNRDGVVDFEDLVALAAAFGAQGLNLAADIDGSGRVDQADVEALRSAYTFAPPDRNPPLSPGQQPPGPTAPDPDASPTPPDDAGGNGVGDGQGATPPASDEPVAPDEPAAPKDDGQEEGS